MLKKYRFARVPVNRNDSFYCSENQYITLVSFHFIICFTGLLLYQIHLHWQVWCKERSFSARLFPVTLNMTLLSWLSSWKALLVCYYFTYTYVCTVFISCYNEGNYSVGWDLLIQESRSLWNLTLLFGIQIIVLTSTFSLNCGFIF